MQEKEAQKPNIPAELQEFLTKLKDSGELESYLPQAQEPTLCELLARDFKVLRVTKLLLILVNMSEVL